MHIRDDCLNYYLCGDVQHSSWIDALPSSVGAISTWNRLLLERMQRTPRGLSAHRSGFVTRACILDFMKNEGQQLSPGTMDVVVRWGGWQASTGVRTVMRVCARSVLDDHVDAYGLSMGMEMGRDGWAMRYANYLGKAIWPDVPFIDHGRQLLPLQFRVHVWRCDKWQQYLAELNRVAALVMQVAVGHSIVSPVNRFRQQRKL